MYISALKYKKANINDKNVFFLTISLQNPTSIPM